MGNDQALSRRQFLRAGLLAAASLLVPPWLAAPSRAAPGRRLLAVPLRYQRYTLTCEVAALRMAAEYFGQVWSEQDLLKRLPRDAHQPRRVEDGVLWADPNAAFPGNYRGEQFYRGGLGAHPDWARKGRWGYGVHAPVIAEVATRLGLAAEVFDAVEAVYEAVDAGHVPIVIVPSGGREQAVKWEWHTPQGQAVTVMNAEHAVVVRGYDEQTVWVNDPEGKVRTYPRDRFERAFALLCSGVAVGPPRTLRPGPHTPT